MKDILMDMANMGLACYKDGVNRCLVRAEINEEAVRMVKGVEQNDTQYEIEIKADDPQQVIIDFVTHLDFQKRDFELVGGGIDPRTGNVYLRCREKQEAEDGNN